MSRVIRLICEKKSVVHEHNKKTLELLKFYNTEERLGEPEKHWDSTEDLRRTIKLDLIDEKVHRLLFHAEKE